MTFCMTFGRTCSSFLISPIRGKSLKLRWVVELTRKNGDWKDGYLISSSFQFKLSREDFLPL